jgi:hypothetical protein
VWFALLGILVLGPLLASGYLLLLDAPAGPTAPWPEWAPLPSSGLVSVHAPFSALLRALSQPAPEWANKLLIFATVCGGGLGIFNLVFRHLRLSVAGGLLAGTLFVLNPFVYERLISGQVLFTTGVAALAWVLPSICRVASRDHLSDVLRALGGTALITCISIHAGGFCLALVLIALAASGRPLSSKVAAAGVVVAGLTALNLYWALPAWLGGEAGRMEGGDLIAYAPRPRAATILFHELVLHGFWRREFATPLSFNRPLFLIAFLPVLGLAGLGMLAGVARGPWRRSAVALVLAACLALILGMGISFPYTAGLSRFLFEHLPGYGIYREPQKWIVLVLLSYAVFAGAGLGVVGRRWHGRYERGALFSAPLLLFAATPMMLWSFGGQVRLTTFPRDWARADRAMRERPGRLLVLPWNLYQPMPLAGNRIVANPADHYFDPPTLVSGDPALPVSDTTRSSDPRDGYVSMLVRNASGLLHFGHLVAPLGVRYVALAHAADWADYGWLRRQSDLVTVSDGPHVTLYENEAWRGSVYGLRDRGRSVTWAGLVTSPRSQLRASEVLSPAPGLPSTAPLPGSGAIRKLGIWPELDSRGGRVVGTDKSCLDGWRLGSRAPSCHLAAVAAWHGPRGGTLWRPGLLTQLGAGAASAASLAVLGVAVRRAARLHP